MGVLPFPGPKSLQAPSPPVRPRLLGEKRQELLDQANKLRTGLFKIDETREKVEVMSLELEDAKKKVAEFQKQCEEYLVIIVQQKREADEQQKVAPPPVPWPRPCPPGPAPGPASTLRPRPARSPPPAPTRRGFRVALSDRVRVYMDHSANFHPSCQHWPPPSLEAKTVLFVPRRSQPIVRRLPSRKSSARHWLTMPRRI